MVSETKGFTVGNALIEWLMKQKVLLWGMCTVDYNPKGEQPKR